MNLNSGTQERIDRKATTDGTDKTDLERGEDRLETGNGGRLTDFL